MIIVLEGIDGCGKGTQAERLRKRLETVDQDTALLKLPDYSTPFGKLILDFLKGLVDLEIDAERASCAKDKALALMVQGLIQANKSEKAAYIRSYLSRGYLILDRYWQSAVAYGSAIDGLDEQYMHSIAEDLPNAQLNILLTVPPSVAVKRQISRGLPLDKYEGRLEDLIRCHLSYHNIWADKWMYDHRGWMVIDGNRDPDIVEKDIWGAVKTWVALERW